MNGYDSFSWTLGMSTLTLENEPLAAGVTLSAEALTVHLADGRSLLVPLAWYPRLAHATGAERGNWILLVVPGPHAKARLRLPGLPCAPGRHVETDAGQAEDVADAAEHVAQPGTTLVLQQLRAQR